MYSHKEITVSSVSHYGWILIYNLKFLIGLNWLRTSQIARVLKKSKETSVFIKGKLFIDQFRKYKILR
jgi:hypothetical protein